jgi:hypothetical protein
MDNCRQTIQIPKAPPGPISASGRWREVAYERRPKEILDPVNQKLFPNKLTSIHLTRRCLAAAFGDTNHGRNKPERTLQELFQFQLQSGSRRWSTKDLQSRSRVAAQSKWPTKSSKRMALKDARFFKVLPQEARDDSGGLVCQLACHWRMPNEARVDVCVRAEVAMSENNESRSICPAILQVDYWQCRCTFHISDSYPHPGCYPAQYELTACLALRGCAGNSKFVYPTTPKELLRSGVKYRSG